MLKNLFGSFGNKGQGPAPAPAKGLSSSSGTMSLGVSVKEDGQGNVLLSVLPPETGPAPKLDICLVIDT